MTHLRLLKDPPPPPDYAAIYQRALMDKLSLQTDTKEWLSQAVYLSVKGLPIIFGDKFRRVFKNNQPRPERELVEAIFHSITDAERLISQLTPRELTRIFPITKEYDGERCGWKDYFSTLDAIAEIGGMDQPIGDQVGSLFYDYQNRYVRRFSLFKMSVVDELRAYQGQPSMMEAFMKKEGITPLRMMTDDNGKQFLFDPVKHTTYPVSKKRPRYLKVVKA
jgi:hypothetical protein